MGFRGFHKEGSKKGTRGLFDLFIRVQICLMQVPESSMGLDAAARLHKGIHKGLYKGIEKDIFRVPESPG